MSSLLKEKLDKEAAELKSKLQVKKQLNVVVTQGEARQGGGRAQEKPTGKEAAECRRCSRRSSTRRWQSSRESYR
jgi:hypothetical protein